MHATRNNNESAKAGGALRQSDSIEGEERVVIGVVGVGDVRTCFDPSKPCRKLKGVRISAPYKFVSKEFRSGKNKIKIDGTESAAPNSCDGRARARGIGKTNHAARKVWEAGAKMLRGGAFKPGLSPYDFQGMEEEIEAPARGQKATGLAITRK